MTKQEIINKINELSDQLSELGVRHIFAYNIGDETKISANAQGIDISMITSSICEKIPDSEQLIRHGLNHYKRKSQNDEKIKEELRMIYKK